MSAAYPGSNPSFTPVVDGVDYPQAADINGLQDELVAIGTALVTGGVAHPLIPDATVNARTLGSTTKAWGLAYLKGLNLNAQVELTLATDAVTVTQGYHTVDTEGDAASDDLVTVTPGTGIQAGSIVVLQAENVARVVTVKDTGGNLLISGDCVLSATDRTLTLIYDGTNWRELARSVTAVTIPGNVTVLDRDVTVTDVNTTTAETTVYTFAVPGGTLGTTKALRLMMVADYLNNTGGPESLTIRVKYGATTVLTLAASMGGSSTRGAVTLDALLTAENATGAQRVRGHATVAEGGENNAAGTMTPTGATHKHWIGVHNSVAEDSTANKNLVVTVQLGASSVNHSFRAFATIVEVLE